MDSAIILGPNGLPITVDNPLQVTFTKDITIGDVNEKAVSNGAWAPIGDGSTVGGVTSYPLPVSPSGSNTNLDSTTTALGASGTYTTATPFSLTPYKTIVGSVYSDQSGTLLVEQSWDNTNWDVQSSISVTGGTGQGFDITIVAPKGRLSYTNGTAAQTVFRLYAGGKTL